MGKGLSTRYTRRQWFTLVVLCSVNFASALCASLQAPFYPLEAEKKGATATEYGLVFGVYELVAFISCPIFGKYMDKIGPKLLLNGGIVAAGVSSIMFGLLDMVDSRAGFIGLSFMVRVIESLGASASCTATFSITAVVFPDAVATTIAILEVFYGLGFIVGPTVGGLLFELGGYACPFSVIGTMLLIDGVFIYFTLPSLGDGSEKDKKPVQIFNILKLLPVFLDLFAVTAATISVGFLSATLEPHIRQFGLSPVATGSIFIITGGTYALTAPLVGRLCDTVINPKKMLILGSVFVVISFCFVGPAPFIPLNTTLWMCCIGLVIHGFGYACILISAFIDAIQSAVEKGFPDDITTYGIVSGIWASSFCLGGFIGPSVAGVLLDTVGFRTGTLFVIAVHSLLFLIMTWFVCTRKPALKETVSKAVSSDEKEAAILEEETDAHAHTTNGSVEASDAETITPNTTRNDGYFSVSQHSIEMDLKQ